jgi:hypothetical protein
MAQAFVIRNDLLIEDANNPVRVRAVYPVTANLPIEFAGVDCTSLILADNLILNDRDNYRSVLVATWRDDYKPVVNAEASRRINLVFPEYKQRNHTARVQDDITKYGADPAAWPQQEQDFKVESDRGWQYVADVRTASNAWTAMPTDPTADSIWPPTITPIA